MDSADLRVCVVADGRLRASSYCYDWRGKQSKPYHAFLVADITRTATDHPPRTCYASRRYQGEGVQVLRDLAVLTHTRSSLRFSAHIAHRSRK